LAVAQAALIRLTATLAPLRESHGVRVNCVVPDWVATERGISEYEELPEAERGPAQVPLATLTDAVIDLITDDSLAGKAIHLPRGATPYFLT
jgi:NAD(P)-dependent dehydrogenase (short-subunit alcohol dehydrogenase family)